MLKVLCLSKIYSACHLDVNGIKPGSNSIVTDKHTAEHSKLHVWAYTGLCVMYKLLIEQYSQKYLYHLQICHFDFTGKFSYK